MASKSKDDTKTVTRYAKNGTKVTVSEEQAKRLRGLSTSQPSATEPAASEPTGK